MFRKYLTSICCFLFIHTFILAQINRPKLVVGLVIDQMRWDYLYRYNALYSQDGFKKLLKGGFTAENTMIPYLPTYTAVGHTCIYTGSVPAITGIVGNNWFDKNTGSTVYCTDDSIAITVGSNTAAGKMSPTNLWVTTIADELRLSNNFKSKTIGIALKDRGAILPAGHSASAAYWYDDKVGKWITSSYYMKNLPEWVNKFNSRDPVSTYMSKDWTTLLPARDYTLSSNDDEFYENNIKGEEGVVFPHKLSKITSSKYESFKTTPFANTFTFDFAKSVIENESMGANSVTDFLAISISATDYIGHAFGPNSVEIEDTYLRLDDDIADFIEYLDKKIGKKNYLLFLTADHGAAHIPSFLAQHQIPGGVFNEADLQKNINRAIENRFGVKNVVQNLQNYQLYLNNKAVEKQHKDVDAIKKAIIDFLKNNSFCLDAFETNKLATSTLVQPQKEMMINGYNAKRSGDIQFILKPNYFDGTPKGTTHGMWNPYDAHIPLLFYGWGIKLGKINRETQMTDIAPTISALLKIQMPNGSVGKVITEAIK